MDLCCFIFYPYLFNHVKTLLLLTQQTISILSSLIFYVLSISRFSPLYRKPESKEIPPPESEHLTKASSANFSEAPKTLKIMLWFMTAPFLIQQIFVSG